MKLSPQLKQRLRWQNRIFIVLLIGIVAVTGWITSTYHIATDLTHSQNNYPSEETSRLLRNITDTIQVKAFVSPDNSAMAKEVRLLIEKYQRINPNITLEIIDPVREPQIVRENDIRNEGELIVTINDKTEHATAATEEQLTNALNHLTRSSQDWILFIEGHNERSPHGNTNFDYGVWYKFMQANGLNVRSYNLAQNSQIPQNTQLLIIADPQKRFLEGEVKLILDYVALGGNLLWLVEPGEKQGLDALAETLSLEFFSSVVVDPNTQAMGINDPRFTLITEYPNHPMTENLKSLSIYPTATPFEFYGSDDWNAATVLETSPRTWATESGINEITLENTPSQNGPLTIGVALTRKDISNITSSSDFTGEVIDEDLKLEAEDLPEQNNFDQRVVVIGDSDFASDGYIGEASNLDITRNIVNWLIQNQNYIEITPREKQDRYIDLNQTAQIVIGFGFLLILPGILLLIGFIIWRKRRKM